MCLDIFIRIPPLFIIDKIFNISFGFQDLDDVIITLNNTFENGRIDQIENDNLTQYYEPILLLFIKIIVSCLIFCSSLCIFVLPTQYLYLVYLNIASICVLLFSYWTNMLILVLSEKFVNLKTETINEVVAWDMDAIIHIFTQSQLVHFLCLLYCCMIPQYILSLVFNFIQVYTRNHLIHKVVRISFILPSLMILTPVLHGNMNTITMLFIMLVSSLLPLLILMRTLWLNIFSIISLIRHTFNHTQDTINIEINDLVEMQWSRLKIPCVLRLLWILRLLDIYILSLLTKEIKHETLFGTVKYLLVKGSETFIAVIGMSSFISYFFHYIGAFFRWVLLTVDGDEFNVGKRSAMLFIVLAFQTGLTDFEPEERFIHLCRNFCLTIDFLMLHIHNVVDKSLRSLSINRNTSINRHLRALLVSGFVIVFTTNLMRYFWHYNFVNNWLIVFFSFNIQVVIKILVTLAVYSLHMIDGYCITIWEKLDDYEFYIKSFGDVANFWFSTCIFLNSVYDMIQSGSLFHALFVFMHAYFVVWRIIKDGWRVLIRRHLAVKRVELLADATIAQMSEFDDICPICRQNMDSAKITNCNHYFHSTCLRKWLNLMDNCPLCHNILYQS